MKINLLYGVDKNFRENGTKVGVVFTDLKNDVVQANIPENLKFIKNPLRGIGLNFLLVNEYDEILGTIGGYLSTSEEDYEQMNENEKAPFISYYKPVFYQDPFYTVKDILKIQNEGSLEDYVSVIEQYGKQSSDLYYEQRKILEKIRTQGYKRWDLDHVLMVGDVISLNNNLVNSGFADELLSEAYYGSLHEAEEQFLILSESSKETFTVSELKEKADILIKQILKELSSKVKIQTNNVETSLPYHLLSNSDLMEMAIRINPSLLNGVGYTAEFGEVLQKSLKQNILDNKRIALLYAKTNLNMLNYFNSEILLDKDVTVNAVMTIIKEQNMSVEEAINFYFEMLKINRTDIPNEFLQSVIEEVNKVIYEDRQNNERKIQNDNESLRTFFENYAETLLELKKGTIESYNSDLEYSLNNIELNNIDDNLKKDEKKIR